VAYKELRGLELEIHKQIQRLEGKNGKYRGQVLDVVEVFNRDINVDSFYGIDLFEFPVRVAEVALWLTDHQANIELQREFGLYYARLPLISTPHIIQGNALTLNWEEIIPKTEVSYVFGNPPYVSHMRRSEAQNRDMEEVFKGKSKEYKSLDYVSAWFIKALEYIKGTAIQVAFVSTNSITQGEHVTILWEYLLAEGARINFAHRSFKWSNLARGKAAVFVVIIGFATFDRERKELFEYVSASDEPIATRASNINPYLVDAENRLIKNRMAPLCNVPKMAWGTKPSEGGFLLLTDVERAEYIKREPLGEKYIRQIIGAHELLHNIKRWCFWLADVSPSELRHLPLLMERLVNVRDWRLSSKAESTRQYAEKPYLFKQRHQPTSTYIAIPAHSSEARKYIPMAFCEASVIAHNSIHTLANATLYHFGTLQSSMHMAWTRQVCGRLKGDYRYSNVLVYNNFAWPDAPRPQDVQAVSDAALAVLDARQRYPQDSLADLYDPLAMPKDLLDAHRRLDRAVDRCYRREAFKTDSERLRFLFERYAALTASEVKLIEV
jgi:hypothetical protein